MKKLTLSFMIFGLIAATTGIYVSGKNTDTVNQGQLQIVTSLPLVKNITENIGGTKVTVTSIVQGPNCDHEYEASAGELLKLAKCNVFVKTGMGADPWADKLTSGITGKKTIIIDSSENIKPLKVRGMENPHYWGDPKNVMIMAKNILNGLIQARPDEKAYFSANYQKYVRQINQTATELANRTAKLSNKEIISYTGAFPYFYRYFGFDNRMTVELSCEQEVSPRDLATAARLMKTKKLRILIGDAGEPHEPDGLAKETKSKVVLLWATTDESGDYLKTLRRNVEMLVTALQ